MQALAYIAVAISMLLMALFLAAVIQGARAGDFSDDFADRLTSGDEGVLRHFNEGRK